MTEDRVGNVERDEIHEAAAEWLLRLQEPELSLDETMAWQAWMGADPRHARAFQRVETTWHRFHGMPAPALVASDDMAMDRYDGAVPISDWRDSRDSTRSSKPFLWRRSRTGLAKLAWAASIAAVVVVSGIALYFTSSREVIASSVVETAVGENRSLRLADGSTVMLGGRTRLKVELRAEARELTLMRGEAFFTVAKDPARPFSVRTGPATVTAVGTEFNVRRAADRVVVAVLEGSVLMEPRVPVIQQLPLLNGTPSEKRRPRQLNAGSQSMADVDGIELLTSLPAGSSAIAWQTGRIDFDREPLRYALESVNRYAGKPIVLGDERLGDLRISGAAFSNNIVGWISSLESALDLRATEEPHRIVLTHSQAWPDR